ncbi:glycosyltransferase family 71 protein [Gonapodya prolifera JEL478]|uniref:Glycosyltransferase family 71 protein n=1 Tax=Gonapodya prolifera (strain JEL478) TaxID=1344416 RepID=A0A139ARG5_GONPJ|nr:glycosyltransferase family 71 protein [Gonapodya prolifera JEL478]|eukprot:KXS19244.1 glycosyltransferase family 71 protein [Gonapodya prolifera JEL478]
MEFDSPTTAAIKHRESLRRIRPSRSFLVLLFFNIVGWLLFLGSRRSQRSPTPSSNGLAKVNDVVATSTVLTSVSEVVASSTFGAFSDIPTSSPTPRQPDFVGRPTRDRNYFGNPVPPSLSLTDFIVAPERRQELLLEFSVEDFKTLGERIREFFRLHRKLRVLEDFQTHLKSELEERASDTNSKFLGTVQRSDRTSVHAQNTLYEFQRFMSKMEELLFPWVRPTYPSLSHLYRTFARGPRSRGLVMTTAKGLQSRMAMVGIMSLRATGCDLPIEFMYAGDDDLPPETRRKILSLGDGYDITMRDITSLVDDTKTQIGAWAIKPFGIMFSSFTEVVFSDADVVWFFSPQALFEDPVYVQTGTIFYYDRRTFFGASDDQFKFVMDILPAHLKEPIPSYLQSHNAIMARQSQHQQDSAVIAIDKSRENNFYGLLTTCRLNLKEERDKVIYRVFLGDKETFWMGWEMAGSNGQYGWNRWPSAQLGYLVRGDQDAALVVTQGNYTQNSNNTVEHKRLRICSYQSAHLHPDGTRLHWFNGGPLRAKFFGESSPVASALEYWAVERHSRWDINPSNIFCLRMREGLNMTVDNEGNVLHFQASDQSGAEADTGFDYGVFKADYEGGMGGAVPHRLGETERYVISRLEGWWEESGRDGARSLEVPKST